MSSLITESPLLFSPQLAATIGLEEAILLQVLHDAWSLQGGQQCQLSVSQLNNRLPFWQMHDLQRVAKSLADKGVMQVLSPPVTESPVLQFQFDQQQASDINSNSKNSSSSHSTNNNATTAQQGANRISPYWQPDETVLAQLAQLNVPAEFARQHISEFVTYWTDRGEISHSWSAKFHKHVVREWRHNRAEVHFLQDNKQASAIQQSWQPSPDCLEILQRTGINISFIEDAIAEFVLYWRERGDATTTWNSKFIQHVKRQWARYTATLKYDTEPQRIPANWQPEHEVYDILAMANIDSQFAQNCLQEFILYWKDSNQLHSSWNTKFLQHVKYCWANQHQLQRASHEGQQTTSGSNKTIDQDFVQLHTDRSWREGL